MAMLGTYILPKDVENLKKFKYDCRNDSISYKYVISPLCDYLVSKMPLWWAPNVLTFLSLAFNALSSLYFYFEAGSDLSAPVSQAACFLFAFTHILYIILDNCDGKQARRTGTSSALGLLIDHGCDSFTVLLVCFNLGHMTGIGTEKTFGLVIMFSLVFYNTTYEEYLLHKMYFPPISGPDEGNLAAAAVAILSGVYGYEFWDQPVSCLGHVFRLGDFTLIGVTLAAIATTMLFMFAAASESLWKCARYLLDFQAFWLNIVLLGTHYFLFGREDFFKYSNQLFICFSLTFSRIAMQLMISCVTDRKFSMKSYKRIVFLMALTLGNQLLRFYGVFDEESFYYGFCVCLGLLALFVADFVFGVLFGLADGLGVKLLTIRDRIKVD